MTFLAHSLGFRQQTWRGMLGWQLTFHTVAGWDLQSLAWLVYEKYYKLWNLTYLPVGVWHLMMSSSGTTLSGSNFDAVAAMALASQCDKFSGPAQSDDSLKRRRALKKLPVTHHSKIHAGQTDGGKHGLSHATTCPTLWFFSRAHFRHS